MDSKIVWSMLEFPSSEKYIKLLQDTLSQEPRMNSKNGLTEYPYLFGDGIINLLYYPNTDYIIVWKNPMVASGISSICVSREWEREPTPSFGVTYDLTLYRLLSEFSLSNIRSERLKGLGI